MNDATATQLRLLDEIRRALDGAGVDWWLFGGWAMDAHAGRITRDHADIEVFIWLDGAVAAREALTRAGFTYVPSLHPEEAAAYLKDGQEVDLTFLVRHADDSVTLRGRWSGWCWPAAWFEGARRQLQEMTLPVMALEGLLELKTNFANQPHGAPLRAKDVEDIERLRAMIAEQEGRT